MASSDKLDSTPYDPGQSAPLLHVRVARTGTTSVITVAGEIDMYSARELEVALTGQMEADADAAIVIADLNGVSFMGSVGLAVLHEAAVRAAGQGVQLRLAVSTKVVTRALEVSGLISEFALFRTVQDALAA